MRFALAIAAMLFLIAPGALEKQACAAEGGLFPVIPRATGGACVREPGFMRREHMNFLSHRRDASVREGKRDRRESFSACLTCHAVIDSGGQSIGYDNPKHFCRVCHDYTAVRIDCFECHNARPGPPLWQSSLGKKTK